MGPKNTKDIDLQPKSFDDLPPMTVLANSIQEISEDKMTKDLADAIISANVAQYSLKELAGIEAVNFEGYSSEEQKKLKLILDKRSNDFQIPVTSEQKNDNNLRINESIDQDKINKTIDNLQNVLNNYKGDTSIFPKIDNIQNLNQAIEIRKQFIGIIRNANNNVQAA